MNRRYIKQFLIFTLFFVIFTAFLAFTFYDLKTAEWAYSGRSLFTDIFAYAGKLPAFAILLFASIVMARCANADFSAAATALKWLYRVIAFFAATMLTYSVTENFITETITAILISIGCGVLISGICIVITEFIDRKKFVPFEKWALVSVILVIAVFATITVLKLVVGRMRFEDIMATPEKFSYWYSFDFFGEGNSFPSGHVGLAATLITIPMLLKTAKAKLYVTIPVSILCLAFPIVTAATRIISGQHYMTDIIVSLTINLVYYLILCRIFYSEGNLSFDNSKKAEKIFRLGING